MSETPKAWTDDMGEISGFGGGYEAVCRAMVMGGIAWLDAHPDAQLKYEGSPHIFGVIIETTDDAKALERAMMDAPVYLDGQLIQPRAGDDCTGAMHHAAVQHCMAYKRLGWDEYQRQLREREPAEA